MYQFIQTKQSDAGTMSDIIQTQFLACDSDKSLSFYRTKFDCSWKEYQNDYLIRSFTEESSSKLAALQ